MSFSLVLRSVMGLVTLFYVSVSFELEKIYAVVAVYAFFCISSALEQFLVKRQVVGTGGGGATTPSPDLLPQVNEALQKVLETQNTQIQALDYIVGFIRSSQANRPPS